MTNAYILHITYGPTGPKLDHQEFFLSIARTLIDKVLRTSHFNTPHVRTENLLQTDSNGDHFPEEIPRKEGTKRKPSRPCFERTMYKARHAHKRLYTVLPKYSKIQVLPGITSCRLVKDNKQAIELNSLLINNMPEG